jgi:F-type H+-transporting ATPase subunit b
VSAILVQLGLDHTLFIQMGIFAAFFFIMTAVYFKPFLRLFEARHKRIVQDREAAVKLMSQADAKFEEYKKRLNEERLLARKEYESLLAEAKKEEANILAQARGEAKRITQDAADSVNQQREQVRKQLESDVEGLARTISETLLRRG